MGGCVCPDPPDKKDESDLFLASDLDLSKGGEECSIDAKHNGVS